MVHETVPSRNSDDFNFFGTIWENLGFQVRDITNIKGRKRNNVSIAIFFVVNFFVNKVRNNKVAIDVLVNDICLIYTSKLTSESSPIER
jgi:hypothetical protein